MELKLKETFQKVKAASKTLALLTDDKRNEILRAVADAIIAETPALLKANALDLPRWTRRTRSTTDCNSRSNGSGTLQRICDTSAPCRRRSEES